MTVLVTGGAGYIGAHIVAALIERGKSVVVVDDLSTGVAERTASVPLEVVDLASAASADAVADVMSRYDVDRVIHLAARKRVDESIERPTYYYRQNVDGLVNVLQAMHTAAVTNLVFSSSAAVYGESSGDRVTESSPTSPVNPYGETKLVGEWLVKDAVVSQGLKVRSLRYFNVAGAASNVLADRAVLNLIPMVFERIDAGLPPRIFGDDYPTADGTCVRDFVHVKDLADAHLAVLDDLDARDTVPHGVFNVGTGRGVSVREVVDEIARVTGVALPAEILDRRSGDPAAVVADASRIRETLGWRAQLGLREMVESAWQGWRSRRP